ncbi:hypothetical protein L210DRAFT_3500836 [Boletus edulis BED1]|uniref:Uncharacterized protein n=1 Tax=Boletus edulis BED1 TaxID=1328754 RepID=A0AAD4C5D1_BOLED|nr:hypothetical protein L210DRAFT_3500836 [Boletus edulis BED1]
MAPRMLEKRSMSWKKTQRPLTNWRPNLREGRAMDAGWICTLMREKGTEEGSRHLLLSAETSGLSLTMSMMPEPSMARRGMLQRRRKANWEKGVDKEGIQYLFLIAETKGLNRPIMPESSMARRGTFQRRKSEGQEESQLLPLIAATSGLG